MDGFGGGVANVTWCRLKIQKYIKLLCENITNWLDEMNSRMHFCLIITTFRHWPILWWTTVARLLASSSNQWLAQLPAERKSHWLEEISFSLKPVGIPLMSINGYLGMLWSPQHGWDLQPLNRIQSHRFGLPGFTGRYILLLLIAVIIQGCPS